MKWKSRSADYKPWWFSVIEHSKPFIPILPYTQESLYQEVLLLPIECRKRKSPIIVMSLGVVVTIHNLVSFGEDSHHDNLPYSGWTCTGQTLQHCKIGINPHYKHFIPNWPLTSLGSSLRSDLGYQFNYLKFFMIPTPFGHIKLAHPTNQFKRITTAS